MCQVFVKKCKNYKLCEDKAATLFQDTFEKNPDGFGWLDYSNNVGKTLDPQLAINQFCQQDWMVFHFRKATTGLISEENCHPFKCERGFLFHNGRAFDTSCGNSDSKIIAASSDLSEQILKYSNTNRFAVVHMTLNGLEPFISLHGDWIDSYRWWVANEKNTSKSALALLL